MQNRLDLKTCLRVFNGVQTHGEKKDDEYHCQGFIAWSDFDGYNCFLRFNQTTATMMFHGKYHLECPSEDAFIEFERKLLTFKV